MLTRKFLFCEWYTSLRTDLTSHLTRRHLGCSEQETWFKLNRCGAPGGNVVFRGRAGLAATVDTTGKSVSREQMSGRLSGEKSVGNEEAAGQMA